MNIPRNKKGWKNSDTVLLGICYSNGPVLYMEQLFTVSARQLAWPSSSETVCIPVCHLCCLFHTDILYLIEQYEFTLRINPQCTVLLQLE